MPRPIIAAVLLAPLLCGFAPSSTAPDAKTYANCSEINAHFKGGIGKKGVRYDVVRSHGEVKHAPLPDGMKVSTSLYTANRKSDRDNDGIACEKH